MSSSVHLLASTKIEKHSFDGSDDFSFASSGMLSSGSLLTFPLERASRYPRLYSFFSPGWQEDVQLQRTISRIACSAVTSVQTACHFLHSSCASNKVYEQSNSAHSHICVVWNIFLQKVWSVVQHLSDVVDELCVYRHIGPMHELGTISLVWTWSIGVPMCRQEAIYVDISTSLPVSQDLCDSSQQVMGEVHRTLSYSSMCSVCPT